MMGQIAVQSSFVDSGRAAELAKHSQDAEVVAKQNLEYLTSGNSVEAWAINNKFISPESASVAAAANKTKSAADHVKPNL